MKGMRNIAPFGLRMPDDLREAVSERAKANGRSMNSEIVQILQDALEGKELPPAYFNDIPVRDLTPAEEHFWSLSREEQIAQIEKVNPLQAEIERISDAYSKKLIADIQNLVINFTKKPT